MKTIVIAGPPASGKSAVLRHALTHMQLPAESLQIIKLDCADAGDVAAFTAAGHRASLRLSGDFCPDHHYVTVLGDATVEAIGRGAEWLVVETAGLCQRCSPFLVRLPALCVLSLSAGLHAPMKFRSLIAHSDAVVLTKTDLVSQFEREAFCRSVHDINPGCWSHAVDGLSGEGVGRLCDWLWQLPDVELLDLERLRIVLPRGLCSYCTGGV